MGSLNGKVALITGGSRGLGLATATEFLDQGADVVIASATYAAKRTAQALADAYPSRKVMGVWGSVQIPYDVHRMVDQVEVHFGHLDILVCCAGVYGPMGPLDTNVNFEWMETVNVNLYGTMLCCREVLPVMKQQKYGKIILISGGGATKPMPFFTAYAASKAAVVAFGASLAAEVAADGIDVNSISPGALNTRMLDQVLEAGPVVGDEFYANALNQKVTGGDPPESAAKLIAFLASPACDGINGRLISAVWDNWIHLPEQRELLAESTRYTMRRVIK